MQQSKISEFLARGVIFEAHEAVAVAQQLIANAPDDDELRPPFGPPTIDNVEIAPDGSVSCPHCGVTPAVSEIGILLDALLPRGVFVRVPGGLRYTIARALSEVDAPPFDSVAALSGVLARYERGNPRDVLRAVVTRAAPSPPAAVINVPDVPVRAATRPEIVYQAAVQPVPVPNRTSWFAIGAVAASISFSASYVLVSHSRIRQKDAAPIAQAAPPSFTGTAGAGVLPRGAGKLPVERAPLTRSDARERREPSTSAAAAVVRTAPLDERPMFSPAFASNGTALFFHTGRSSDARSALAEQTLGGDLEVMTILDDGAKNYHVQPSPDGGYIAFDSDRDGERGVYVATRSGANVHRVSGPGYAAVPTWSPDGKQLAFVRGEPERPRVWNLWLTTLATGETRRLTNFRYGQTWNASWFADGTAVAYTHEDRLAVLNLANGVTRTYASPVAGRLMRTPAVSPDGRHIIFQVARSGAWLVDLTDGSMRCVLTDPTAEEFAWSPDGRRVAFHSRRDGRWGIWIMAPPAA